MFLLHLFSSKSPVNRYVTICSTMFLLCSILSVTPLQATESEPKHGEFIGAMDTIYPDWFKLSFLELADDLDEATSADKRLMLLFHQDGCPYCNAFVERNLSQKDIEETLKTKFDVIEFNLWGDREVVSFDGNTYIEKDFAKRLNVQFTPTILFLTEEGKLSLRLNGYSDPDRFRLALQYVQEKMEAEKSFADFLASSSTEPSSKALVSREYFTGTTTELENRPGKATKPLLLLFEQGSCKNCEILHDQILASAESQKLLERFDVYQVDMWGRESFSTPDGLPMTGRQWSAELGINYAPTLVLYSPDGKEVIRSEAFFKSFHTQSILDYVASEAWRNEPSFQRYLSARAETLQEQGIDVNIWD